MHQDHERFTAYYQEYKDKVFTYLMYRLNFNRALAEDLLMDVVLKAYQNFDKFDSEKGSFKTWFFSLAHNHLVNYWRDQKNRETTSLEGLEEGGLTVAVVEAASDVSQQIEGEKIQRVLALMNPSEREIISLKYLQELSNGEIAQIQRKKEGAIRTQLSRSLQRFGDLYQKIYLKSGEAKS